MNKDRRETLSKALTLIEEAKPILDEIAALVSEAGAPSRRPRSR